MSLKYLNPSIYKQGSKFELKKVNQIDTLTYVEHSGDIEEATIASETITTVKINGATFQLPLRGTGKYLNNGYIMEGKGLTSYYHTGPFVFSKGVAGLLSADIELTIEVMEPINNVRVDLSFAGVERVYNSSNFSEYKGLDNLQQGSYSLDWDSDDIMTLINDNGNAETSWTGNSSYVNYANDEIYCSPYVKSVLRANGDDPNIANRPDASEIVTRWTGGSGWYWTGAEYSRWRGTTWQDADRGYGAKQVTKCDMWPATFYPKGQGPDMDYDVQRIKGIARYPIQYRKDITKVDDYHYQLKLSVPVKYVYSCVTQYNYANVAFVESYALLEGKMFYDLVTSIAATLKGYRIFGVENERSYSLNLDGSGHVIANNPLTEDVVNASVLKIPESSFITADTVVGNLSWRAKWVANLLEKYRAGKYSVKLDVDAAWCIQNDIKINSEVVVKLIDGSWIGKVISYDTEPVIKQGASLRNPVDGREYLIIDYQSQTTFELRSGGMEMHCYTRNGDDLIRFPCFLDQHMFNRVVFDHQTQLVSFYILDSQGNYNCLGYFSYASNYIFSFVYHDNIQFLNYNDIALYDDDLDRLQEYNESYLFTSSEDVESLIRANDGYYVGYRYVNIQKDACVFKVKNIERSYGKDGFLYTLSLLEDRLFSEN